MPACPSCGRDAPFEGARCKRCRDGKTKTGNELRALGKRGTPGAATLAKRSRYRNAPKRGWS